MPRNLRRLALLLLSAMLLCTACATPHQGLQGMDPGEFRRLAGQLVMVGFRGLEPDENAPIAEQVREGLVGGVVLFTRDVALGSPVRNVESPDQVRRLTDFLQSQASVPLLIAVDQEGGRVARLGPNHGFPETVSAQELGELQDLAATREAARALGETLARAGCNLNLAPVVDVNLNPENPVIGQLGRSFSADPEETARQGLAFVRGLRDAGILSSLKHFPGHGSAWNDSHLGLADVTETWSESELLPFSRIIASGEADTVMTAHVFNARLDAQHPATLSHPVINGILRRQLGFDGVVISDDMQMKAITESYGLEQAVTLAVNAGVDILLFGNNLGYDSQLPRKVSDILLRKVESGEIPLERIQQSHARIMRLKEKLRER